MARTTLKRKAARSRCDSETSSFRLLRRMPPNLRRVLMRFSTLSPDCRRAYLSDFATLSCTGYPAFDLGKVRRCATAQDSLTFSAVDDVLQ